MSSRWTRMLGYRTTLLMLHYLKIPCMTGFVMAWPFAVAYNAQRAAPRLLPRRADTASLSGDDSDDMASAGEDGDLREIIRLLIYMLRGELGYMIMLEVHVHL